MRAVAKHFSPDFYLLAVSLAIAFVLWMIAKERSLEPVTVMAPVAIENVPDNIEARPAKERAQLTMNVPMSISNSIRPELFLIRIDWETHFSNADWAGLNKMSPSPAVTLEPSQGLMAPDLDPKLQQRIQRSTQVTNITPASIRVLGQFITRMVRFDFSTTGSLEEGYRLAGKPVLADSEEVIYATASRSRFSAIGLPQPDDPIEIKISINIQDRSQTFFEPVPLSNLDLPDGVSIAPGQSETVDVKVVIEELRGSATVKNVAVSMNPVNSNISFSYSPKSASVSLKGPVRLLNAVQSTDLIVVPAQAPDESWLDEMQKVPLKAIFSTTAPNELRDQVEIGDVNPSEVTLNIQPRFPVNNSE